MTTSRARSGNVAPPARFAGGLFTSGPVAAAIELPKLCASTMMRPSSPEPTT